MEIIDSGLVEFVDEGRGAGKNSGCETPLSVTKNNKTLDIASELLFYRLSFLPPSFFTFLDACFSL